MSEQFQVGDLVRCVDDSYLNRDCCSAVTVGGVYRVRAISADGQMMTVDNVDFVFQASRFVRADASGNGTPDPIHHPPHYTQGSIECIDAIRAALTEEEWRGYCKGNIIKYTWRERHKGGKESLAKAAWYLERLSKEGQ